VRPGEPLVEITPLEDTLMVEARIKPSDIAFISPNQKALVKLTAYDFSIYGGLDGKVQVISSDSTVDEKNEETYYIVTVKTTESALRKGEETLPVIPGMVASVDIMTGKKSVLDYLLKPILKARDEALRER
jgi:adhesin transport system membrane fusion protein